MSIISGASTPDGRMGGTSTPTQLMLARHSTRYFLEDPIPHDILENVFAVAQHTASNSNVQPWRVKVLSGAALHRITNALTATAKSGEQPNTEPLPEAYHSYRSAVGKAIYGPDGYNIPREDKERLLNARLRNYSFFGAPCGLVVCMDRNLARIDVFSVGMYVQTLCMLFEERGLSSCIEASVAGYPKVRRLVRIMEAKG